MFPGVPLWRVGKKDFHCYRSSFQGVRMLEEDTKSCTSYSRESLIFTAIPVL